MASTTTRERVSTESPAGHAWQLIFELYYAEEKARFAVMADEFDLSPSQALALYLLGLDAPVTMGELAEHLACDASNVTGIVDRLETRGLLERRPDDRDRRVKLLVLTTQGRRLRERATQRFFEPPAGIASLPAAEQRALRDLLSKALGREG